MANPEPYYRTDLALVHHLGYGFHADNTAPGILRALEPVRARGPDPARFIEATLSASFGSEPETVGLVAIVGRR